ncbi:MAG: hypothetical protein QOI62_2063 [Solirubrobacteraceae bacterium]|jgi:hypothetical protein|nr:hypothetical protein [Solirubrobacteraceae bacterium]
MLRSVLLGAVAALSLVAPAAAAAAPELHTSTRLDDRRFVAAGPRAYDIGTEAGRYPAMGFHTRGEMGGIWSPPIKLLDGIWFGLDGQWIGPATEFTSGYGYARMKLPDTDGLQIERTDVVPGEERGVLVGLKLTNAGAQRTVRLMADAHSELMSSYPWGETKPFAQTTFNLPDQAAFDGRALVFTEQGTPPAANADPHDWAAAVGTTLTPVAHDTGPGFRGPQQASPVICPASGPTAPPLPATPCDDTAYGQGQGGELGYDVTVPAGGSTTVWFAVAGSESGAADATALLARMLADPDQALADKVAAREALAQHTRLSLPGDPRLAEAIDWGKQNLADLVQEANHLEIRETNAGTNYPPPKGVVDHLRWVGAGFPDYPWLFAVDGEYTAFASVAMGQFEPIEDHLRALRTVSQIVNGDSGKVIHETVNDGSVFFGALADAGNTDETAKFPSAVALVWRWTGDRAFLDEMYDFTKANMHFIVEHLDADGDGWPEGLGNVERPGMGDEKLDNTVYLIRGLSDLADMADAKGDEATRSWAEQHLRDLERRFEGTWWIPKVPGYADSLSNPTNAPIYQRHWIGVTPTEVELNDRGAPLPGLAQRDHANATLDVHEMRCYGDASGMFHTGEPGCDHAPESLSELHAFTINTAIVAVGEGNYGRLGPTQQARWTTANVDQMLPGVEQPGAMPEIASPSAIPSELGDVINRPFPERPSVLQAWGNYGTVWPVVHQQLGVEPDLGRGRLRVVAQPPSAAPIAGDGIRLGTGEVAVRAQRSGSTWTTTVDAEVPVRLRIGAALPRSAHVRDVRLDGRRVRFDERRTNRGLEVTVRAPAGSPHTVTIRAR